MLTNGDQIFPAMLQAIREAKRRVSFETYIYDDGEMAEAFTAALRRSGAARRARQPRHRRGRRQRHRGRRTSSACEAAGCRLAAFNTPSWYSLEEVNYRTHRKILVVDGLVAFTGGVGIDDHWLGNAQDKEHWRDTHGPHRAGPSRG